MTTIHPTPTPAEIKRTRNTWHQMLRRCTIPTACNYHNYGRRGIAVCHRWRCFEAFLFDMGGRPSGLEIDRIDNDGDYEPGNCRWVTKKQQMRNTRQNHVLAFDGRSQCLIEWAEELGIARHTLSRRIERGWSAERALTTPMR